MIAACLALVPCAGRAQYITPIADALRTATAPSITLRLTMQEQTRQSPGVMRFLGGLIGSTIFMIGYGVLSWDDEEDIPEAAAYGGVALTTGLMATVVTAIWEPANAGIFRWRRRRCAPDAPGHDH